MATTLLQIPVDEKLKDDATRIFDALGLDLSMAVRMFLKRSVLANGIPFSMTLPKQDYRATRALRIIEQANREAEENGSANMTLEEINAEIDASRCKRAARKKVQE